MRRAVLIVLLALMGCSPLGGFDRTLRSTNHEEIADLRLLMEKHRIPYRNTSPDAGMAGFSYRGAEAKRLAALREKLGRRTEVKYKEPEAREYLQELLIGMDHDFIVVEKADGVWIKWFPDSPQQNSEVSMKVVQHMFDLQAKVRSADCPSTGKPFSRTVVARSTCSGRQ